MRHSRMLMLSAIALSAVIAAGCGQPEYFIKGLSLPPGSAVVAEVESEHDGGAVPLPMVGEIRRSLTVEFDNAADWQTVADHIDQCLQQSGYAEITPEFEGLSGQQMPAGYEDKLAYMMRAWVNDADQFAVSLMNNQGMLFGMPREAAVGLDQANYTMTVVEFKGD